MKKRHAINRFPVAAFFFLAVLFSTPATAVANTFENFIWLLDQTHVFPVTSQDISSSKDFLNCLSNADTDVKVAGCIEIFKNTPLGQQAASGTGAPSWFWDLIDLYVAYRTGDFWGVVGKLGEAAICLVAQVMTGGDICGLIEQLADLAEAFGDAAKAVAKFVASVGGAAWEGIKSVGCSLGLGGCSKGSPPEQIAYAWVFQPEIPSGVAAREKVDPSAFDAYRTLLEADAKAKPYAKLHIAGGGSIKVSLGESAVKIASGAYTDAVEAAWSEDIAKHVLAALAKKRSEYDNPQQVAALAAQAAAALEKYPAMKPSSFVENRCTEDFSSGFGFAHVDRWLQKHPDKAKGLGNAESNRGWCGNKFWVKNKEVFAKNFRLYLQGHSCPLLGQTLTCGKLTSYKFCLDLMGSVSHQGECGVTIGSAGKEAAEQIAKSFKSRGSTIPCLIQADSSPLGQKPANFVCTRPPQRHYCKETYDSMYGNLPVKLVNCLVGNTPSDYAALESKVVQAVASLKGEYGGVSIGIDQIDPLVVRTSSADIVEKVKVKNPNHGFAKPSSKPGFDYVSFSIPRPVDGVNTPVLGFESSTLVKQFGIQDKLQEKLATVKPGDPDPMGKTTLDKGVSKSGIVSGSQTQAVSGGAIAPPMPKGLDLPAPAPTQGKLPTSGDGQAARAGSRTDGSAEIRSGPRVTVAGRYTVLWGQRIAMTDSEARQARNGICEVMLNHETINAGDVASGPFLRRWTNRQNPAPFTEAYPSIPPAGKESRTDTLPLRPGENNLTLTLDPLNQVKESNEGDNAYQVTVIVNGSCGLSTAPGGGATPSTGTRSPSGPPRPSPSRQ